MTEDTSSKVTDDAGSNPGATTVRQRKKRKWDQPAESVICAGLPIPGMVSFAGAGAFPVTGLPGMVAPLVGAIPSGTITSAFMSAPQISATASLVQQNAAAIVQKINQDLVTKGLLAQPKIQDELIAREIVINDADPTVRYKLTKRQTQEEIQAKTGAVVITRGRYRPPNGPVENEKPLYLHISAGAHLKDTAERIKAVDQAAVMVEEILKQGRQPQSFSSSFCAVSGLATPPFSTSVFVGLEADPTFNLVYQIRGPNDQYINHIMNETGATVVLRGRGSGNYEGTLGEELQQPLHLFISSDNAKSLDDAKSLADNLIETVRSECLKSRLPTYPVPAAVSISTTIMPTASVQSSIPPYQVPTYAISSVSVGPYAGVYPQPAVSYTQTHVPNLQSLPLTNTYSLSSSIPQPESVNTATLMATEINKLSTRVYNAVPPPQQLLSESTVTKIDTEKSGITFVESSSSIADLAVATSSLINAAISLTATASCSINTGSSSNEQNLLTAPSGLPLSYGQSNSASYPQLQHNRLTQPSHIVATPSGTSYNGYGGIYPQATPLQQVALALQRPPLPVSVNPGSLNSTNGLTKAQSSYTNGQSEKQPPKRRKFQELPVAPKEPSRDNQNLRQGAEISNMGDLPKQLSGSKLQSMPPPRSLSIMPPKDMPPAPPGSMPHPSSKSMPPPSSRIMPSPSSRITPSSSSRAMLPPSSRITPPPQTVAIESITKLENEDSFNHETSFKLVEYGEEEDDDLSSPGAIKENGTQYANGKPFWAP